MTDDQRVSDPVAAVRALPKGSGVILRHRDAAERARLAAALAKIARRRGLMLLIAGDATLARLVGADGLHLSEPEVPRAYHYRGRNPHWIITASAHSESAVLTAFRADADAAIMAPVFWTRSHPEKPGIGISRLSLIAARVPLPVYALGGLEASNVGALANSQISGIAAIGALLVP